MTDVSAAMEYMNAHTRDDFKEYLATCERELAGFRDACDSIC